MSSTLTRPVRFVTVFLAALQFALPGVASVADGMVARSTTNQAAHVEDVTQKSCKPPHSADCLVCRFLSTTIGQTAPAAALVIPATVVSMPPAVVAAAAAADLYGFNSRAPPPLLD